MAANPRLRRNFRTRRFVDAAEAVVGQPAIEMDIPGGGTRASCRILFEGQSVIATHRKLGHQRQREIDVLTALAPSCPQVPRVLGVYGDILIQEDVGRRRLSKVIWESPETERPGLARAAIASLLEVQRHAATALAELPLPDIGCSDIWLADFIGKIDVLGEAPKLDRDALAEALTVPATRFVRWDARAANAAVHDGDVRWFDFEYCGRRHGAEDIAWLIADEVWPVPADTMVTLTKGLLTDRDPDDFLDYLCLFATIRTTGRLHSLVDGILRHGWSRKREILGRDKRGRHRSYVANLCQNGALMAGSHPLTEPLVPAFETFAEKELSANPSC